MFTPFQKQEILHRIDIAEVSLVGFISDPTSQTQKEEDLERLISLQVLQNKVQADHAFGEFTADEAEFMIQEFEELIKIAVQFPGDFDSKNDQQLCLRRLREAVRKLKIMFADDYLTI